MVVLQLQCFLDGTDLSRIAFSCWPGLVALTDDLCKKLNRRSVSLLGPVDLSAASDTISQDRTSPFKRPTEVVASGGRLEGECPSLPSNLHCSSFSSHSNWKGKAGTKQKRNCREN